MSNQPPLLSMLPLTPEQLSKLQDATKDLSTAQIAWLSGYLWGQLNPSVVSASTTVTPVQVPEQETITLISASQTGNARHLAEQLRDHLVAHKLNVELYSAGEYKFKQIHKTTTLIIIASTQGEGDPPEEAIAFYKYLHSKKASEMKETSYAVFSLGDTSYEHFCKAGKDFDERIAQLGATRLLPRVDADVEYQAVADEWIKQLTELLKAKVPAQSTQVLQQTQSGTTDTIEASIYHRDAPFTATLLTNQKITGRNSDRDIRHIEISLEGSDLQYQPGDALGVWFNNSPEKVDELIALLWLKGDEPVTLKSQTFTLKEALLHHCELTQNSAPIVKAYAQLTRHEDLLSLVSDKIKLQQYADKYPINEMVRQYCAQPTAQDFVDILRPLTPRLYSIASSQQEVEDEVHLTLGVVRYDVNSRAYTGGASGFLADSLKEGDSINVFIEKNAHFRLPKDNTAPVIMIGPGTGIAPFRAFMQQRENDGATGKNWLFFGNPHFVEDFLYQVEWQRYVKSGLLTHIDLAWSRDQAHKIYVQDKLRERGNEIWQWLQQGAYLYVCGDASHMAKDVEQALLEIVMEYGNKNSEEADEYLSELRLERRYQRDVY
ncbi:MULTISPECIES: NADPH-dependent assimilatory sulfite reductase flavoprotein subunit [Proteus]|uniref:Sulfite reductase [NADPH] flavoprotein alpha-component n=1 Tax=Proteus penneri TaxID=102862 RepID=A0ABS0W5F1_9GAMM|nr:MULTISPECIES: NADPH-dependent assimilatory sulfite reductase flavoprotein subunit [Proteus]MBJ2117381.1 NADPH-dependent assimilatory sulfite reductase flavoprotein subunit [Proteus penneri]NBM11790.1 NADPH-dependent assimilatory sulfite reductase flavoprotein subunit [Proteus sp. G2670]NBM31984.1 NADPH-dependent assimilatory sulfite reductase flavoprotein subunit [Proteus sp. G2664]NBM67599.1 NADPH-dependent assimilatory sulfite reductase flavoprotein subunit [Proteus sp. G2663]NBM96978.1 N